MKTQWIIPLLVRAMNNDALQCTSAFERGNCIGLCTREIRELAVKLKESNKLTAQDISILKNLCIEA